MPHAKITEFQRLVARNNTQTSSTKIIKVLACKISHTDGDGWQIREIICENAVKNWYAGSFFEKSLMIWENKDTVNKLLRCKVAVTQ